MRTVLVLALVLVTGSATGAQDPSPAEPLGAQGKPDFSGRWVREDGRGSVLTVIQDGAVISITSTLAVTGPSSRAYGLGGREIRQTLPGPPPRPGLDYVVTTGEWRGRDLLLFDTYAWGSTQTQVWSLDSSGVLHVEVIRPPARHTVTFKRQ